MPYGYITTSDEWKKQLKNFNRGYNGRKTWDELYGTINTAAQKGTSIATRDYTDAISQAYGSAFGQKAAIANSNLFTGYKDAAIADIDYGLAEAYDTYRQNYLTQKAKVDENAALAREQISTALGTEAENFKAYQDSYYGYLTDLYNKAYGLGKYEDVGGDETLSNMFASDPLWNRYLIPGQDGENPTLLTSSELYETMFDPDTKVITAQGTDFYNQMMNQFGPELGKYGFNEYLSNANPELYEWSQQQNPYNYTEGGTNAATFKQSVGLSGKDETYTVKAGYESLSNEHYFSKNNTKRYGAELAIDSLQSRVNDFNGKLKKTEGIQNIANHAKDVINEYAANVGLKLDWSDYDAAISKMTPDLESVSNSLVSFEPLSYEDDFGYVNLDSSENKQILTNNVNNTLANVRKWAKDNGFDGYIDYESLKNNLLSVAAPNAETYESIVTSALKNVPKSDLKEINMNTAKEIEKILNEKLLEIDNSLGHTKK